MLAGKPGECPGADGVKKHRHVSGTTAELVRGWGRSGTRDIWICCSGAYVCCVSVGVSSSLPCPFHASVGYLKACAVQMNLLPSPPVQAFCPTSRFYVWFNPSSVLSHPAILYADLLPCHPPPPPSAVLPWSARGSIPPYIISTVFKCTPCPVPSQCFRGVYEDLFYAAGVDLVLGGHIHAYERTHPVYK